MAERAGYRGYMGSRPYFGARVSQHVQNLVIRDYCGRHGFHFLLSATEYAMPDCHMILEQVLDEVSGLDGIVLYSIFMLPPDRDRRLAVYRRVLDAGATLHGAVENLALTDESHIARIEDIWAVQQWLPSCPTSLPVGG